MNCDIGRFVSDSNRLSMTELVEHAIEQLPDAYNLRDCDHYSVIIRLGGRPIPRDISSNRVGFHYLNTRIIGRGATRGDALISALYTVLTHILHPQASS